MHAAWAEKVLTRGGPGYRRGAVLAGWVLLGMGLLGALWAADASGPLFAERAWWPQQRLQLETWYHDAPVSFALAYMLLFMLLSALALPGCGALALLAGPVFGTLVGALLVGLASTLGATLSFLAARHWFRDGVQHRLGTRLAGVDAALARHGRLGLFWLRLLPVVPFPVLNPLLGLSQISLSAFFWPSLAGLTLGSVPYVWSGGALLAVWQGGHWNPLALAGTAALLLATGWFVRQRLLGSATAQRRP